MSEYCRDDFGLVEQADDDFKMWQGLVGPHYTPSVSEDGTLSWSNDGQLPNPEDVSIKGPPGEPGPPGAPGPGVPAGGTTGQLLAKASDEDFDTEWIDAPDMDAGGVTYDPTEAYDDGTVGKELTTINSALSSLSSVTEIIDTASGAIASFPDGAGLPMRSLLATIEPQQDLHGQDAPYPAGGGKNKCSLDSFSLEKPQERAKRIAIDTIPAGTYTISWVSDTTATTTMQIQDANNTSMVGNITITSSGSVTKTFTSDAAQIYAFISTSAEDGSTATISNLQIELGSTATSYAPYSNICPISGWTGLSGERDRKNLVAFTPGTTKTNNGVTYTANSDYTVTVSGTATATSFGLESARKTLKAGTYTLSATNATGVRTVAVVGSTTPFIDGNSSTQFTITSETEVYVYCRVSNGTTVNTTPLIQIETGSTASPYEAYTSLPITVSWQTEAGTVYGGTVDAVTGVLTADMPIVDMGTLGWVKAGAFRGFVATTNLPEGWPVVASTDVIDAISDCYKTVKYNDIGSQTVASMSARSPGTTDNKGLAIKDPSIDSYYDNFDATSFASAVSGRHVAFKSAIPQTYQLTPQQISTLIGNNTVFVDCGSVSVTYQASIKGYIDKVLAS